MSSVITKQSLCMSAVLRAFAAPLAIAIACSAPSAFAQEAAPAEAAPAESAAIEIVVTGSRIRTQQYDLANPVVGVDKSAIENSGETNITNFLVDVPALSGSTISSQATGADSVVENVGLNLLDLRNLGTNRTLVLVDGRRHVSSLSSSAAVDINSIPVSRRFMFPTL
jgi:iron complex outermembrane recepter protein